MNWYRLGLMVIELIKKLPLTLKRKRYKNEGISELKTHGITDCLSLDESWHILFMKVIWLFFPHQTKVDKIDVLFYATFFFFSFPFLSLYFMYIYFLIKDVQFGHMVQGNFGISLPLGGVLTTVFENLCASSKQRHNRWVSWSQLQRLFLALPHHRKLLRESFNFTKL